MQSQPVEDIPFTQPLEKVVTFNLIPDVRTVIFKESLENKEVNQLALNASSKYTSPEAARRGFRNIDRKDRGGGGRKGGGRKDGPRKRHPNFAARNRKIGKGGPTGRGAFSGQRRRRPTGPAPPDDSDGEIRGYAQDVDMKTGRIKRRQRPKSDERREKENRRKEEDKTRKASKKKRPGPRRKDREEMKEKVKRFWREAPQPKSKKAPKIVLDGFESERGKENEKTKRKGAPKDFDDLRMESKAKIKKQRKAEKKNALRKQRKRERKKFAEGEEKSEMEEEKEPTLSEMEGLQAEFGEFLDEDPMDPGKLSTKPVSENIQDPEEKHDTKRSLSDVKEDFEAFMKQQEEFMKKGQHKRGVESKGEKRFDQLDHTIEQDSNFLNIEQQFEEGLKAFEEEHQSEVEEDIRSSKKLKKSLRSSSNKVERKKSSTDVDIESEGIFKGKSLSDLQKDFDLFMKEEIMSNGQQSPSEEEIGTRSQIEMEEVRNQSDYETKEGPNLFDDESDNNLKTFQEQRTVEDDFSLFEDQKNIVGYSNDRIDDMDSLPKQDHESMDESKEQKETDMKHVQKDDLTDESEYDEDFEKDYEGIRKYFLRDSETSDSDKVDSKSRESDGDGEDEFTSASDDDEVWNREKEKFVKARKKRKKKEVSVEFEGAKLKVEMKKQIQTHKTLSDLETENAVKNGILLESKNDEVIISTESEELEEKSDIRRGKKSHGEKIISSDINELEINEGIDKCAEDRKIIDSEFSPGKNEVVHETIAEIETAKPVKSAESEVLESREKSAGEEANIDIKFHELSELNLKIPKGLDPGISIKEEEKPVEIHGSKVTMDQKVDDATDDNKDKPALTQEASTPKSKTEDFNLFEGLEDDEEKEEEEEPKDNSFLKENWARFANDVSECFGHHVEFPPELPDDCPSEEEAPVVPSLYEQYYTRGFGNDVFMEDSDDSKNDVSKPPEVLEMEESKDAQPNKEESENLIVTADQNTPEEPITKRNGINEYLEEDQWDLWYKFHVLMSDDKTRTYDNCAALFKAKLQEILTRKKAPIPPWEEPGLDEYERDQRRVQREWDKTERYYALKTHEPFKEFLQDNEGEPKEEVYDSELEETYRFIFDLINTNTEEYDHQAYKDTLSREELAEIYSEEEVEEELLGRELRKQEKEEAKNKPPPSTYESYLNTLEVDPLETFQTLTSGLDFFNVPDHYRNRQTNLVNSETYSEKMEELGNTNAQGGDDSKGVSDVSFNIKPISSMENRETEKNDNFQVNKREQAKKMWQYFQQLMKERHEKNIEKFLTTYSPTKRSSEEGARKLWQQYVAFTRGEPVNVEISADTSTRQEVQSVNKQSAGTFPEHSERDPADVIYEKPEARPRAKFSQPEEASNNPSPGWKTLMQRIDAMKLDSEPIGDSPTPGTGQPQRSDYGMEPQYRSEAPNTWVPPVEPYRSAPSYDTPRAYPPPQAQVPYGNAYGQPYEDPRRVPGRSAPANPYYAAPTPPPPPAQNYSNYSYGFPPPPRGVQGVTQSQFLNRGDYYDPYGKPLSPNVSINRMNRSPDMGYQNPDFTQTMDERAAYMANQADPYTANRSRVGWPGDHSDKFHNRRYFTSDIGGQQTYIPRDFSGQPGDHSDRYLNRSNFRNPNFGYRADTYNISPFGKTDPEYNSRSIKWWQSGTRPLASSGLQTAPPVDNNPQPPQNVYEPTRRDSMWPEQASQHHDNGPNTDDVAPRE